MFDLLSEKFPEEIAWNILKYCEHPVARIYKDNIKEIHYTKNYDMFAIVVNNCPLILLNEITSNMKIMIIDDTVRFTGSDIIVFNDVAEYLVYINCI